MGDLVGLIIVVGGFIGIVYFWTQLTKLRVKVGSIQDPSLRFGPYSYVIGDNLFEPGRPHGIQVMLPKLLPEILIDSHNDGKAQLPTDYILPGQRLILEGDFNNYFQVYCAPQAVNMALTILTPDVMAVLVDSVEKYDVRISGRTLQIFANKKINKDSEQQAILLGVAQKLVSEIDHKMKSFKDDTSNHVPLKVQSKQGSVKFGTRYIRTGTVAYVLFTALFASVFYVFALWDYLTPSYDQQSAALLSFWLGFAIFPCLTVLLVVANRVGLLSGEIFSPKFKRNADKIISIFRLVLFITIALIILVTLAQNN